MTAHVPTLTATAGARLAPGVYFNMPDTRYHADPALGSGDVRDLKTCAMYYWQHSAMNPLRDADTDTPDLLFGRALHKIVLEGRTAFEAAYAVTPSAADFPGALDTAADLTRELKALKDAGAPIARTTGKKEDLVALLKAAKPDAVILDEVLAKHAADCAQRGAVTLKREVYERVIAAAAHIAGNPRIAAAFQAGRPEVTVIWEADGVPCKARLDYIRLGRPASGRLTAVVTDLKSFSNSRGIAPERAIALAVAEYRLDMQAAHYMEGLRHIPAMITAGMVSGAAGIDPKWLAALASLEADDVLFFWSFFQKDAPGVTMLRQAAPNLIKTGLRDVQSAYQTYRDNLAAFGTNWRFVDPMADASLDVGDMPRWLADAA